MSLSLSWSESSWAPQCERICGYRLVRVIASGGQATVYEVRDDRDRAWALKVYKRAAFNDGQALRRFERESREVWLRLGGAARRANLVIGEEYGRWLDQSFVKMKLLQGETLTGRLAREGQMAVSDALALGIDLAEALAAAHRQGVLHRDIKPDNLFIDNSGRGYVLDWGSMLVMDPEQTRTARRYGTFCSIGYVPVEQYTDDGSGRTLTPACDLYALGVILYEAIAGYHPLLNWRRGPVACPFPNPKDQRGLAAAVSAFRNAVTPVRDKVHSQPWLNAGDHATLRSRPSLPALYELQTQVPPRRLAGVPRGVNALLSSLLAPNHLERPQRAEEVSTKLRLELARLEGQRPAFVHDSAEANARYVRRRLAWGEWRRRVGLG